MTILNGSHLGDAQMPVTQESTLGHLLAQAAAHAPDSPAFTFVDFAAGGAGRTAVSTWGQLDRRVQAAAAALRRAGVGSEPVAVVASQCPEYIVGFLAAIRAGAIAVPLFPPSLPRHADKLAAALTDARPTHVLTTRAERSAVAAFCAERRVPNRTRVLAIEDLTSGHADRGVSGELAGVRPRPEDCAYLQYTSGSTRTPSGVEITHANVVANVGHLAQAYGIHRDRNHMVGWLPLYHDMGLLLMALLPVVRRVHSVITDPMAFVQQPVRWLRLLSAYPGAITAAPNFAFDYCARRVREEDRKDLALDKVAVMINGSEPIRPSTLNHFMDAFGGCGARRVAIRPSYGLAEATLIVSASPAEKEPQVTAFDRERLAGGVARVATKADPLTVTELVACGHPYGQAVAIVDPATGRRQPGGAVGEIWVSGPNVGRGYWRSPQSSAETFRAVLAEEQPGEGAGKWLRTGDLGVWHAGQLYITGRLKDLIIIDGVNHYPQDLELTVQNAHPAIRRDHVAAFSVPAEEGEGLVIVAEYAPSVADSEMERRSVAGLVRVAVATAHALAVRDFVLAPRNTVPRTTSGKVARRASRDRYLSGAWTSAGIPEAASGRRTP
ncbi:fatty acyl-AMP ligase [Kitasatospora sp. NPDC050543]|uniref:fatty acyl-AMP ligase n=1 Tax=Kitasatospora sp. NPDC050543 TaxID=3364054 RepID=UPI0037B5877C